MSDEELNPLEYEPQEIDVSQVNSLGFTDEMTEQLLAQIKKDLSGLSTVKDVLSALKPLSQTVVKIALNAGTGMLEDKLDELTG